MITGASDVSPFDIFFCHELHELSRIQFVVIRAIRGKKIFLTLALLNSYILILFVYMFILKMSDHKLKAHYVPNQPLFIGESEDAGNFYT